MICQRLNRDGFRCRRQATHSQDYHGNPEIYGLMEEKKSLGWVKIYLCDYHRASKDAVRLKNG